MKKLGFWIAGTLVLVAGGFGAFVALQEGTTPAGTTLAGEDVSGMTRSELEAAMREWWLEKQTAVLQPTSHMLAEQPEPMSLASLGIEPDWRATFDGVPMTGVMDSLTGDVPEGVAIKVVWRQNGGEFGGLAAFVEDNALPVEEARVEFREGKFVRTYEIPSFALDAEGVGDAALSAMVAQKPTFELPMQAAEARITKELVDSIQVVVSSFSTTFSAGNRNRTHNIKLAADAISGVILMPGEEFSYNGTVGRRTAKSGYKLAGVYANGRHEVDIGGGICQVSTTLFNAVALADLEITNRLNHSMPVPYVSVGRDATVDYDRIDFKFRNSFDQPIAVSSEVIGGKITFYVLGTRKLDYEVRLETTGHSSWGTTVKYVSDPSLGAGKTRVIEKGSSGRKCTTWRVAERDGEVLRREQMFESIYRASPRIIARGSAKPKSPEVEPPTVVPVSPPDEEGGG